MSSINDLVTTVVDHKIDVGRIILAIISFVSGWKLSNWGSEHE